MSTTHFGRRKLLIRLSQYLTGRLDYSLGLVRALRGLRGDTAGRAAEWYGDP